MANHNHVHSGCCKHENVKYCQKCGVPYCVDCGKEWAEEYNYTPWMPYYPITSPTWNPCKTWSTVTLDNTEITGDTYTDNPDTPVTLTCAHN